MFCAAARQLRRRVTAGLAGARSSVHAGTSCAGRQPLPLLLLPDKTFPNLGSRSLRLTLDRLSADWQERLRASRGAGRDPSSIRTSFMAPFTRPMVGRSWARPTALAVCGAIFTCSTTSPSASLRVNFAARPGAASQSSGQLKPTLARVEAKTRAAQHPKPGPNPLAGRASKTLPDYRARIGIYPLWSLVTLAVLAHLCGCTPGAEGPGPRFGKGLSQAQRRALGVRQQPNGYPAPSQPTFCRMMELHRRAGLGKHFPANPAKANSR